MKELLLIRRTKAGDSTIGEILYQGRHICFTLEDKVREVPGKRAAEWKIPGATAIPVGVYDLSITMSNRFKKFLPLLDQVPGYSGVRIHTGNTKEDTEGCILVGMGVMGPRLTESRLAMQKLDDLLKELGVGTKIGNVRLRIENGPNAT